MKVSDRRPVSSTSHGVGSSGSGQTPMYSRAKFCLWVIDKDDTRWGADVCKERQQRTKMGSRKCRKKGERERKEDKERWRERERERERGRVGRSWNGAENCGMSDASTES